MKYNVIASSSAGNCTIIDDWFALDMGVTIKAVAPHVLKLKAVWMSHIHSDHFKEGTVRHIARHRPTVRFIVGPELVKACMAAGVSTANIDVINEGYWYNCGNMSISPFRLVHDVPNYGLKIRGDDGESLVYAVDTATMEHVTAKNYTYYLVEGNYGEDELAERIQRKKEAGEYIYEYDAARRHMSRESAMAWLARNMGPESRYQLMHQHVDKEET